MTDASTDDGIAALLAMKKTVTNPDTKTRQKGQHLERNYDVEAADGTKFGLYTRQSVLLPDNFSCGLRWRGPGGGEDVCLVRYNGPAHPHRNAIEGGRFVNQCHIHSATSRYMARLNGPAEGFAEPTTRYNDLRGALVCLMEDCKIEGLVLDPEQVEMKV